MKCNCKNFIDRSGKVFTYQKTLFCQLEYHKKKRVKKRKTASILHLNGASTKFTIRRPPEEFREDAGVLYLFGAPWIVYEFSQSKKPKTRKRI